ncbi:MAG TPA: YigZ family protein [Marmoricola sp.]|nr:YigZ family protein [Marmoricola sp.]
MTAYRVPARPASATVEVKRSRFLCRLERVSSEEAARAVVDAARKEHWDARHHCSAFVLGPDGRIARSSDDGEPAGTAGAPMLEVLRGAEVSDVVAVVTRWFGGVLLGAGGLVRAYRDAVRAALEVAGTRERQLLSLVSVTVPHADVGRFENELRSRGHTVRGVEYADAATVLLAVDPGVAVGPLLAELTAGTATWSVRGEEWVDLM